MARVKVQYVATKSMLVKSDARSPVVSSVDVVRLLSGVLGMEGEEQRRQEHFWTIGLDARNRVLYVQLCGLGGWTSCPADPRVVLREALMAGAPNIILAHNHPTGDATPSPDDIQITERLSRAALIMGIRMLDHVVVTGDPAVYCSLAERGLLGA